MMSSLIVSLAASLAHFTTGSPQTPAGSRVPPPVITASAERTIVRWEAGEVRCGASRPDGSRLLRPWPDLSFAVSSPGIPDASFSFAIDGEGRVISVTPLGDPVRFGGTDIAPSLVASRFPAGQPHDTCLVSYAATSTPIATARVADLLEYSVRPGPLRLPAEGWNRIADVYECHQSPRPQALVRRYPDHRIVPETPGRQEWTLTAFDLDEAGAATNARIIAGTRSAVLDKAALEVVSGNRFASGARQGCLQPFVRRAGTLEAPASPPEGDNDTPRPACGGEDSWAVEPRLVYPEHYRQRSIEGWARLTYDVAPWGAIDNVRVIESQPSADFGRQAQAMLRQAKVAPQGAGATGCTQVVRYRMASGASPDDSGGPD